MQRDILPTYLILQHKYLRFHKDSFEAKIPSNTEQSIEIVKEYSNKAMKKWVNFFQTPLHNNAE